MDRWAILFQGGQLFLFPKDLDHPEGLARLQGGWFAMTKIYFQGQFLFCNESYLTIRLNLFFKPDPLPHKEDGTPWSAGISKLVV